MDLNIHYSGMMCLVLSICETYIDCVSKNGPTLKRYSSKL